MHDELVPKSDWIFSLIDELFAKGVRRPGYRANRWASAFCARRFREYGLENVRLEPVTLPYWEPLSWSLRAIGQNGEAELQCYPLPHSAATDEIELELVAYDASSPSAVEGKASLHEAQLLRIPPTFPVAGGLALLALGWAASDWAGSAVAVFVGQMVLVGLVGRRRPQPAPPAASSSPIRSSWRAISST